MSDPRELMRMIANGTSSAAWQEAERMQRELQSRFAVMGLGRSGPLLEASLENYLRPAKQVAESLSKEYQNLIKSFSADALPIPQLREDLEQLVTQQATIAEERLRREAEASGLGYQAIEQHMDSQREHLVSSFVQALEIAERRKRIALEQSWPTLAVQPEDADRAPLTADLFSRSALDRDLRLAISFAERHAVPLSIIMVDVDDFKKINDSYGHPAGDLVLLAVASKIRSVIGSKGRCYRYGGEEFTVLLPNATGAEASVLAARFREEVEQSAAKDSGHAVTISAGIATHPPCPDVASLLQRADAALYKAKQTGKNRVVGTDEL